MGPDGLWSKSVHYKCYKMVSFYLLVANMFISIHVIGGYQIEAEFFTEYRETSTYQVQEVTEKEIYGVVGYAVGTPTCNQ